MSYPTTHLWVDFNMREADGRIPALAPNVGDMVQLFDGDGNTCLAYLVAVEKSYSGERDVLMVKPRWDTWVDA